MIQLLILLLSLLAGAILSSIISMGLLLTTYGLQADIAQDANLMRPIQFIPAICASLLPSIATAWIYSGSPRHYLSVKKIIDGRIQILTLVYVLLSSPIINLLGLLNKQVGLPAFMAPIEEWIQAQETLAEQLTTTLSSSDSVWITLTNLIVIATTAGITEESLFRGAL